jgi:hypothetical protein
MEQRFQPLYLQEDENIRSVTNKTALRLTPLHGMRPTAISDKTFKLNSEGSIPFF